MKFILVLLLTVSYCCQAELMPMEESFLADISGQSGVTLEGSVDLTIADIAYQQTPESPYQVLHDVVARYNYGATTIDVTESGALRFGLPEFIHFDELSFGLYNSSSVQVDTSAKNSETYTIYAATLGDAFDGFTLNVSGATFDSGSNQLNGDYVNTNTLENNLSAEVTITNATDISLSLTSDDDCSGLFCDSEEDFAQITIVDEDGNVIIQEGQSGQNHANLNHSFDSAIQNNFIMHATLTGTFKMGGAIEMFGFSNPSIKR